LVEAGASKYLAEAATSALIDEYVEQLRTVGIAQIQRRPRAKRISADRPGELHHSLPARFRGLDPVEVEKLEQNLTRNRELIERRLFDTATLDQLGADTGITKERIRQITKRAARTIGDLANSQPRFAVMAAHEIPHRPQAKRIKPTCVASVASPKAVSILPELDQPHNRMTKVVEAAPGDTASIFALADHMDGTFEHVENAAEQALLSGASELDGKSSAL
jgi:RNA polymerase sigma-32 factor